MDNNSAEPSQEEQEVPGRPSDEGIWGRAGADTWRVVHGGVFIVFDFLLGVGVMAAGSYISEIAEAVIFTVTVLGVVALVFSWNVARTPFRQRNEARAELSERLNNRDRFYTIKALIDDGNQLATRFFHAGHIDREIVADLANYQSRVRDSLPDQRAVDYVLRGMPDDPLLEHTVDLFNWVSRVTNRLEDVELWDDG